MTTPRAAIGLSERLRERTRLLGQSPDSILKFMDCILPLIEEAAIALDAIQARVEELEADNKYWKISAERAWLETKERNSRAKAAESRATSAEQERDEALERAAKMAEQHAWSHPSAGLLGPEMNSMEIAAAIRRLAAGTEKEN